MVKFEINGQTLEAEAGSRIIDVADAAGIPIPRFCYHSKLSLAASCRMCLVDVKNAPKPQPACSTPVMDGMVVFTRSPRAIASQRAVMEFLLINHPLDCPICDQGGECELQDIAQGYGSAQSSYHEPKRIVVDEDLGPLVATDMTRCIHCTRCVRFGQELAGVMELGAPGRGEHMHIATYLKRGLSSELSGNVADLCPVGSLTAKPSRYQGRPWEYQQHASIAPYDMVGSELLVDTLQGKIKRISPGTNESLNECWLSDRDRNAHFGMRSDERLLSPRIKVDGKWQDVDWDQALVAATDGLQKVIQSHGANAVGTLAGNELTNEELYLLQKLTRGIGSSHIDVRLDQIDFSDQGHDPRISSLNTSIASLQEVNAALIIGSDLRQEQPLLALRLRKAVANGAQVAMVSPYVGEQHTPVAHSLTVKPEQMVENLAAIAKALQALNKGTIPEALNTVLSAATVDQSQQQIAEMLHHSEKCAVLVGAIARSAANYGRLRQLAALISDLSGCPLSLLVPGNLSAAELLGAIPHRDSHGQAVEGGSAWNRFSDSGVKGVLLANVEPEFDGIDSAAMQELISSAEFTVALTSFSSEVLESQVDVMLPIATWYETTGSRVNGEGIQQHFAAAVEPAGEARPAWKILRVLGNLFDLTGFEYISVDEVQQEILPLIQQAENSAEWSYHWPDSECEGSGLARIVTQSAHRGSSLLRRSDPLQQTLDNRQSESVLINASTAAALSLNSGDTINITQSGLNNRTSVQIDYGVADNCMVLAAATPASVGLSMGSAIELTATAQSD